jgi:3-methylfumaryl-CoA hydratase
MTLDNELQGWVGRSWERSDVIDGRLLAEFNATFSPFIAGAVAVPPGIFWCLFPDIVGPEQLGEDGHPRIGQFMPDVGLPRRMWAGGALECLGSFRPGDTVIKRSKIEDIATKSGKSGELCFVTVRNEFWTRGEPVMRERQDIVYRAPAPASAGGAGARGTDMASPPPGSWSVNATSTLLFRYSAMTFNGHRIHYDHPYATGIEGYAGLVVHGPLQASLMLNRAAAELGRFPATFAYRGLSPLIGGAVFHVTSEAAPDGGLALKVIACDGTVTMSGEAR